MLLYALSVFSGAFLLFLVQPLIARIILPWFGGTASVWAACLMFFQAVLLGGYLYSHLVIRRLRPKAQAALHMVLLAASVCLLPILPGPGWKPADGLNPERRILLLLAATVGIPYLVLSTTGPLVQAWYARANSGASPYRLYALSNVGSLIALVGYPAAVEPLLRIPMQAYGWSAAYVGFVLVCLATAWIALRKGDAAAAAPPARAPRPHAQSLALWAALAFCPSALLVGITTHLTQNIAPLPLLWVVPLALYLVSFILTFESERWYRRRYWFPAFIVSVSMMMAFLFPENRNADVKWAIPLFVAGFFCCAITCHGELYRLRPAPAALTHFYLMLSLGGALGGFFVSVIAPAAFNYYYEVPLALLVSVACVALVLNRGETALPGPSARIVEWGLLCATGAGLVYLTAWELPRWSRQYRVMERSFYGVLRVEDTPETETTAGLRELHHGTINHGAEFTEPRRHREPTTYYGPDSGVGLAIRNAPASGRRIGIIGLGAGTLAAYGHSGDFYRFYEINPLVVEIAQKEFYFLKESPAAYAIALGDARLSLEREQPENFDVLAVDAFSGDSIPVHLLTVEAFREYIRHVRPQGIVAVHVSNKYLNLEKVVARATQTLGLHACMVDDEGNSDKAIARSDWVLVTAQSALLDRPEWKTLGRRELEPSNVRLWTDDYSSILEIIK
jgi:spermidine synthase